MTVSNIGDINREIAHRCTQSDLKLDCGADGIFGATVAIVGEAPGERERLNKMPLCGASGKYLWDELRSLGLNRRTCYVTNTVKRQLLQSKDVKDKISNGEKEHYVAILRWELQQLPDLQYVLCLGNYALEAVTGLTGILHHRGSVYETELVNIALGTNRLVTVVALLNPAYVLREPKWKLMFKFDAARLGRVLSGKFQPHVIDASINPSTTEALRHIERMHDEALPVALDIETTGNETACIGLANTTTTGMCINLRDRGTNRYSVGDECAIRVRLSKWLNGGTAKLVMQNGMFDSYWLAYKDRLMLPPSYFDTMLAHHTLYPSLPHNLGFLTSQYTEHPFYKDEGKSWKEGGDIDTFWTYNVKDCCITLACMEKMLDELKAQKLDAFFFDHVMRLQPHLIGMTVGGLKVDELLKIQIAADTRVEVDAMRARFLSLAREATGIPDLTVNPNSPKQLADLYFRKLRLVGRGIATDVKNRERMRQHPKTPPIAREMLTIQDEYAKQAKFLGTYAEMTVDKDGRIRCEYKQTGVISAPGRLSSSATMWGSGTNLQNQPPRSHQMFLADRGYAFTYFDLSQAEARVVGWKSPIPSWIEQFEQARVDGKYDCHRALASTMFGVPYDDVPMYDFERDGKQTIRYKAKRCRHGLNYRMGADRLATELNVTYREGDELWNTYHRVNPELTKWWENVVKEVRNTRTLYNAYGRRWILLEPLDDDVLEPIVAFYPQSTIGDKVSRCIYLCESDPEWPTERARMALTIHDALVALHEDTEGVRRTVLRVMKRHAEEPISIRGYDGVTRDLVIPAEFKCSVEDESGFHRWSTLEKVKVLQ